jgi:hypothetical protein
VVLILTILLLIPLLTVAAYTVDLSAWHARMTHLQGSADAAALAGTVWMPNLPKAVSVASDTLSRNGLVTGEDGVAIAIGEGGTPTSLRVSITDHDPPRLFAFGTADPDLTRSAEADYFLPLPLGSPLNYFGGDRSKTQSPDTTTHTVTWPVPYNSTTRPPTGPFGCNVGTTSAQALGRWTSVTAYSATGYSGTTRCLWTAATATTSAAATTQVPSNVPCNRVQSPTSSMGRWNTGVLGALPTYTGTNRHASGTGNRQCTWAVPGTQPPNTATWAPANAPCMVTGNLLEGSWNKVLTLDVFLPASLLAAPLCQWTASVTTIVVPGPNPIPVDRNPGFWAQVEGPGTVTAYGDAFSTRCTTTISCSTVQSEQHRTTGYWYVMRIPPGATAPVTVSVYDALYRRDGVITAATGDFNLGAASTTTNPDFTTEYRLYRQDDPLDVNVRTPVGAATSGNQADGSCWWTVTNQPAFDAQWRPLCTITPTVGGAAAETYLLNVRTYDAGPARGAGLNGYALQAIASSGPQPALYAYSDMGMFNNGSGTFYLAEVAPTFAGKVLAIDLWDPGDVSSGTGVITPRMPSLAVPRPVADTPATCTYTASPDPNGVHAPTTPPTWGSTGVRYATPRPSDSAARCAVNTAPAGSSQRFNDEWLHIRIQIPADYACTPGLNPETSAGSCWWGIEHSFSAQPYDVTTWKARIEGNPVHLTS